MLSIHAIGAFAAMLTTLCFVPQAWRVIRLRQTRDLSLTMYGMFTVGVLFWFIYGILLESWPMIISNAVTFLLSGTILVLKLRLG